MTSSPTYSVNYKLLQPFSPSIGKVYPITCSYLDFQDAFDDFVLSRKGMNCSSKTVRWYKFMLGRILTFFISIDIDSPSKISRHAISQFFTKLKNDGRSSTYIHGYGRVLRTFLGFLYDEGYIVSEIQFSMPILKKRRQIVYNEGEIKRILAKCTDKRDLAFILFLLDTGIRNTEVRNLNWGDCDMKTGIVKIENGKGGKFRSVVLSIPTRRALIKYRREVNSSLDMPIFQTFNGTRFTESGLRSWLMRLSKRAGIHITTHAIRRTFAKFSVKQGMDLFHLQALMGHSSLQTTRNYVEFIDEDLIEVHGLHSPVKYILNGKFG